MSVTQCVFVLMNIYIYIYIYARKIYARKKKIYIYIYIYARKIDLKYELSKVVWICGR